MFPAARTAREKWGEAGFQRYFRNTGWMFAGQATLVVSLVINIWIARHLGPANFGWLTYIFAFVGIFGFLPNLGLQDILVRDLVRYPERRAALIGTSLRILAIGGVIAFAITALAAIAVNGFTLTTLLVVLYATIFFWSPINVIPAYFQATVQAKRSAVVQILGALASAALKVYLIVTGAGVIWLTAAYALDFAIGGTLFLWSYRREGLIPASRAFDRELAGRMLRASYPLMLAAGSTYLMLKADQVLIKAFLGEASLGVYAAAAKLLEIWYFVPVIITGSLFPAIINAKMTSEQAYRRRLVHLSTFLLVLAVAVALLVMLLAPWVVPLLFGMAYAPAVPIAQMYVWAGIGYFLMIAATKYLMAEHRLKEICAYSAVGAAVNIVLNVLLIPRIGLAGAAVTSVVSYAVFPALVLLLSRRPSAR